MDYFITFLKCWMLAISVTLCSGQGYGCSYDRLRRCEESLQKPVQQRISDSGQDVTTLCMNVRDDFNCLLRETRCLQDNEKSKYGEILRTAVKYIRDRCDYQGGSWRDKSCFVGNMMKSCENSNPLGSVTFSSHNSESCRKYNQFQDCVNNVIQNQCIRDDERFLGQYLVDKAQDLAWNCKESTTDRGYDGGRNQNWNRDRDRDWDRQRDSGRSGTSSDRYGGGSSDSGYRGNWRSSDDRSSGRWGSQDRNYDRGNDGRYGSSDRNNPSYYSNGGSSDITCCRYERCDSSRMQQCRDSLSRAVESVRSGGFQDSQKCRKARDDFNCLLWQTSCLTKEERDRNNAIFQKAKDYLSRNCDTYARWSENSCYKSQDMKRCENSLSNTRSGPNYEACRSYNNFRDCVYQELRSRCTQEDELLQGSYFIDKAQEMSWQCSNDNMDSRNTYFSSDRRNDYNNRGYNPQYGSNDDTSLLPLDDDDAMCVSRVQSMADNCKNILLEKRRQLLTEPDYDVKQRKTCCSSREYKTCLYDATRRVCLQDRTNVVENMMGRYRYELTTDNCRRVYDSDCSSSSCISVMLMPLSLGMFFVFLAAQF